MSAGGGEVGAERRPAAEDAAADDVEVRESRCGGCAADLDELAAGRRARRRELPAAERDPAREPVDRAEVHEGTAPRRLPEDRDGEGLPAEDGLERAPREAVELRQRELRLAGHAAPHRLHRAIGRLQRAERPLGGAVLHGDRADCGHGEHRGGDGDARCDDERPLAVRANADEAKPHGDEQAHRQNTIGGCTPARALGSRSMDTVETVRGPVALAELGPTLMHEHVFVLDPEALQNYGHAWGASYWDEEVRVADAVAKLQRAARQRDPARSSTRPLRASAATSRASSGSTPRSTSTSSSRRGVYAFLELPSFLAYRSDDALVELFVREIREGIDDTGVKAAFLKCAVEEHGIIGDVPRILSVVAATADRDRRAGDGAHERAGEDGAARARRADDGTASIRRGS